jgi:hypothetical protein
VCVVLQERAAALENELRKSKRAEQKLQALLYRLRQDVAEVKQGADLMAKLEDQRSLEYEVDFLTNKVKVCPAVQSLYGFDWRTPACASSAQTCMSAAKVHVLQGAVLGGSPLGSVFGGRCHSVTNARYCADELAQYSATDTVVCVCVCDHRSMRRSCGSKQSSSSSTDQPLAQARQHQQQQQQQLVV